MAKRRYDRVAMALHWIIAATIIAMLALAYRMVELPFGDEKFQQYQLHKSLGVTVLVATALRLAWRLLNPPPPPLASGGFERFAAQAGHWAFYGLMIGIPITGWLMVSASPWNLPTIVWGVIDVPHLPALAALAPEAKPVVEGQLKTVHLWAGYAMVALVALHVLAALRHSIVIGDDTLARMVPFVPLLKREERS